MATRRLVSRGATPPAPEAGALHATLYHYRAVVVAVHDGDTCTVDIDLGLCTWARGITVRLHRLDAPELTRSTRRKGEKARDALKKLVLEKPVVMQTIKDRREKYGRYLAELWLEREGEAAINVNDMLVRAGHARYRQY